MRWKYSHLCEIVSRKLVRVVWSAKQCDSRESRFQKDGNAKHQPSRVWEAGPWLILRIAPPVDGSLGAFVVAGQGEICESRYQVREDVFHRLISIPASVDHLLPYIRELWYRIIVVT